MIPHTCRMDYNYYTVLKCTNIVMAFCVNPSMPRNIEYAKIYVQIGTGATWFCGALNKVVKFCQHM